MKKYSNAYLTCVIMGLLFSIASVIYITGNRPSSSAFCAVWGFIFLWCPQMFPDYDKYRD